MPCSLESNEGFATESQCLEAESAKKGTPQMKDQLTHAVPKELVAAMTSEILGTWRFDGSFQACSNGFS